MNEDEMNTYHEEAREKWGGTEAWKQSEERVKRMGKEGLKKALEDSSRITLEFAEAMKAGEPASGERVRAIAARHYEWLRNFYDPTPEIYRGLAEMYVADERFAQNYEKVAPGLAPYLRDAMLLYADTLSGT